MVFVFVQALYCYLLYLPVWFPHILIYTNISSLLLSIIYILLLFILKLLIIILNIWKNLIVKRHGVRWVRVILFIGWMNFLLTWLFVILRKLLYSVLIRRTQLRKRINLILYLRASRLAASFHFFLEYDHIFIFNFLWLIYSFLGLIDI